jgi:hypothetical protein
VLKCLCDKTFTDIQIGDGPAVKTSGMTLLA